MSSRPDPAVAGSSVEQPTGAAANRGSRRTKPAILTAVALVVAIPMLIWAFGGFAPDKTVRWVQPSQEMDAGDLVYSFDQATATLEEFTTAGGAGWVVRVHGTVHNPNVTGLTPKLGTSPSLATRLGGEISNLAAVELGGNTARSQVAPGDRTTIIASFNYPADAEIPDSVDCAVSPQVFSVNSVLELDRTPTWHQDNQADLIVVRLPLEVVSEQ